MSGVLKVITYELYTLEHSGWVLHARYPSDERNAAIIEAKTIEVSLERATKLIRETYFPDDNHYQEAVVRISPNLVEFKKKLKQSRPSRTGGGGMGRSDDPFAEYGPQADQKPMEPRKVITGMTMMIFTSMIIAGGVTGILSVLMRSEFLQQHIALKDAPPVLFATFILVFLLAALPLISRYVPHFMSSSSKASEQPEETPRTEQTFLNFDAKEDNNEQAEGDPALFKDDPGLIMQEAEAAPVEDTQPSADEQKKQADAKKKSDAAEKEKQKAAEAQKKAEKKKKAEAEAKAQKEAESAENTTNVDEDEPSIVPDKPRMAIMRFLTGTITVLKDVCPQLDTYNKFGLNLLLAGACAKLGQRTDLSEEQVHVLTLEALTMIGGKANIADQFYHKLDTHLSDARYAAMHQMGQDAIEAYLTKSDAPFELVKQAMQSWNKPSDRITGAKIITVMFTDIVSSTMITYKRGDEKAQNYIRKHNSIVRQALLDFNGQEIKHTGDGIMASFAKPADAIQAATSIQWAIQHHNADVPDEAFDLRIGINTGETIREEDDLFGSTVQLAARVCNTAEPGHVYISNVVHELLGSHPFPTKQLPARTLKGVQEAQIFYDILWQNLPDPHAQIAPEQPTPPPQTTSEDLEETANEPSPEPPQDLANHLTSDQVLNVAQQVAITDKDS